MKNKVSGLYLNALKNRATIKPSAPPKIAAQPNLPATLADFQRFFAALNSPAKIPAARKGESFRCGFVTAQGF